MESDGEEDVGLPQAAVLRVARAAAGDKASFAKEAQTALTSCCEQFVRLVTAESLALIEREQRSLVGSSDVARACVALGFGFGTELAEARDELESQRKAAKLRKSSQVVVPPEERARLQELMFAQAAQDMQK